MSLPPEQVSLPPEQVSLPPEQPPLGQQQISSSCARTCLKTFVQQVNDLGKRTRLRTCWKQPWNGCVDARTLTLAQLGELIARPESSAEDGPSSLACVEADSLSLSRGATASRPGPTGPPRLPITESRCPRPRESCPRSPTTTAPAWEKPLSPLATWPRPGPSTPAAVVRPLGGLEGPARDVRATPWRAAHQAPCVCLEDTRCHR